MSAEPRVLLIDQEAESRLAVHSALVKSPYVVVAGGGQGEDALKLALEVNPGVVIIGVREPIAEALPTLEGIAKAFPKTPLIVHSDVREFKAVRRIMLAGAWQLLAAPVDESQLIASIEEALRSAPPKRASFRGTVITVFAAKGGTGKSTVCVNLAAALVKAGAAPLVLDLDSAFGDIARLMKLPTEPSLLDLVQSLDSLDGNPVSGHVVAHQSGVSVLPAPAEPHHDGLAPDALNKALIRLSAEYDFVILDTPANLSPAVKVAFDQADIILLLTGPDPVGVEKAALSLKALAAKPAVNGRVRLSVNQVSSYAPISQADVARQLDRPVAWSLPHDAKAAAHDGAGLPVVVRDPKAKISRSFLDMATLLLRLRLPLSLKPAPVGSGNGVFERAFEPPSD